MFLKCRVLTATLWYTRAHAWSGFPSRKRSQSPCDLPLQRGAPPHQNRRPAATLQGAAHEAAEAVRAGAAESSTGRDQVVASGERLRSITLAVEAIRDMNRQIATAAEEQTSVAEDIARNLAEIVTVARHNEEDLQRTQSASERLHGVSQDLSRLVGRLQD